ncbi:RimK family alpha-L-glutamate ligase [Oceaniglobus trochenteri]|uniref:RimK family alpha-L-glutamate ligase n=1 Tax=Oceaniglobus trochenteri TaxID=2763260 RepID=UPI001CFF8006|nr:RimK family alpha-L-glutamate ligase [Oceaniglobus trochenteri]
MPDAADTPADLRLGWEEWCALPQLALPALKVKVDTGARTSALHAFDIEPFGPPDAPMVRFAVHPIPGRHDLVVRCTAPVHDRREVTSSNGETEYRYVILSPIAIGPRQWPVELTLTDRGAMAYRMLLGRQALEGGAVVAPGESFCQPQLSYDVYPGARRHAPAPDRPLSIAILSREPDAYTPRHLVDEARARGHRIDVIDTARCYMAMNALSPEVHCDGAPLPRYDAVIPRIGATMSGYGAALVRQFETIGTHCLNGSEGITSSRDRIHAHQLLARYHIGMPATAFAASPKDTGNLIVLAGRAPLVLKLLDNAAGDGTVRADTKAAAASVITAFRGLNANFLVQDYLPDAAGRDIRCLVLGGKFIAALERPPGGDTTDLDRRAHTQPARTTKAERDTAQKAARAFKLGLASVDLLRTPEGPKVLSLSATPGLSRFETATGRNIAALVLDLLEKRLRPAPRPPRRRAAGAG